VLAEGRPVIKHTRALGTGLLWLSAIFAFAPLVALRRIALDIRRLISP
jgi:hypothetical protein